MSHPGLYRFVFRAASRLQGPLMEDGVIKRLPAPFDGWTENRDFPRLAKKPFRDIWNEMKEG